MERLLEEDFALVLVTGYPEELVDGNLEFRPEVLATLREEVASVMSSDVEAEATGYGYGADTLGLALVFSSLTALFLSGKGINENMDAWVKLGRRFSKLIKSLEVRFNSPRISEPVALAIAIAAIREREADMKPVALLSRATTKIHNGSLAPAAHEVFSMHPDRYYVFTIELLGRKTHVVAVSSRGEVMFHHELLLDWPSFFGMT